MRIASDSTLNTNSDVCDSDCIFYVQEIMNQVCEKCRFKFSIPRQVENKRFLLLVDCNFPFLNIFLCATLNHGYCIPTIDK